MALSFSSAQVQDACYSADDPQIKTGVRDTNGRLWVLLMASTSAAIVYFRFSDDNGASWADWGVFYDMGASRDPSYGLVVTDAGEVIGWIQTDVSQPAILLLGVDITSSTPTFAVQGQTTVGATGGSPSQVTALVCSPIGELFLTTSQGTVQNGSSYLWYSTDLGANWTNLGSINETSSGPWINPRSFGAALALSPDGNTLTVITFGRDAADSFKVKMKFADVDISGGAAAASWPSVTLLEFPDIAWTANNDSPSSYYAEWMDNDNLVLMIRAPETSGGNVELFCVKRASGTWGTPVRVTTGATQTAPYQGMLYRQSSGVWYFIVAALVYSSQPTKYNAVYFESSDEGDSWSFGGAITNNAVNTWTHHIQQSYDASAATEVSRQITGAGFFAEIDGGELRYYYTTPIEWGPLASGGGGGDDGALAILSGPMQGLPVMDGPLG